ncbi:MAG TPA: hypothetical protein PKW33_16030 [Anaerolineaceae bacterium]|nr:hypothetical protein [Anaerolineaceae bacterium]HPN53106.1 hypothetical protein [Anaerolineaceae bacterium]
MIGYLLAIPVLLLAMMLQTAVVSRLPLVFGTADLLLLVLAAWALQQRVPTWWYWALVTIGLTAYISAMPLTAIVATYLGVVIIARFILSRVWRSPLLSMLTVVFIGTMIYHGLTYFIRQFNGVPLDLMESLNLVVLPSLLLNMLIALPVYAVMKDLADRIYPPDEMDV